MPNILKKVNNSGMYRSMFKNAFGTAVATEDQLLHPSPLAQADGMLAEEFARSSNQGDLLIDQGHR
ncbi:MAG: hypothetical protein ACK43N_17745 [Pirellulaceae bacterium]